MPFPKSNQKLSVLKSKNHIQHVTNQKGGYMNHLKTSDIDERIAFLQELLQRKKKEIQKAPKGLLNVARKENRIQYYFKSSSKDKVRKYLKKSQNSLIKALCQKDYDERIVDAAEKELSHLIKLQNDYKRGNCEAIYQKLIPERRKWVEPIELSDEEFVAQWLEQDYPRKTFRDGTPEYYTDNGERVRSKSEILIANALKKNGIPYRYEAPLYLNGLGTIHPDFTVLNVRERKEYYWEHLGKMDEPEYIENALQRIDSYEKNNIFPGSQLILSHETLHNPINSRTIEKMIVQYLK